MFQRGWVKLFWGRWDFDRLFAKNDHLFAKYDRLFAKNDRSFVKMIIFANKKVAKNVCQVSTKFHKKKFLESLFRDEIFGV